MLTGKHIRTLGPGRAFAVADRYRASFGELDTSACGNEASVGCDALGSVRVGGTTACWGAK